MFAFLNQKHRVDISPWIVIFSVFFILGLWFLFLIKNILILLMLAFIVTVALNPAVTAIHKKLGVPRLVGAIVVYFVVIVGLVTAISFLLPPVVSDFYQLIKTLDLAIFQNQLYDFKLNLSQVSALIGQVGNSVGVLFSVLLSTFSGIFTFLTLFVMSFYMMLDRPFLHRKVMWFTRDSQKVALVKEFLDTLELQLGGWVRGQLILMSLIGVIVYIGLKIIGLPYALPLAVLAALLEILPNVGPTVAAIPAVILAFATFGPVQCGITILFYVVVQQVENNVIVPKILKENVDVNPLVAMTTILIGFELGSVIGALLAIPIYITLRTVYSMWYSRGGRL